MDAPGPAEPLLQVENLRVRLGKPPQQVVNGVSFAVAPGEIVGLAGESGSGKSMTALAVTRLLPREAAPSCSGSIRLRGVAGSLLELPSHRLRRIRGRRIAYIFQEPSSSFNPVFSIGQHLSEVLAVAGVARAGRPAAMCRALGEVGIESGPASLNAWPAAFSGGMLQRLAIACALAGKPDLLVADEPTTALDATTQMRITELLLRINRETGMAILFISHNLALLRQVANRLVVMRLGEIVEQGPAADVFGQPQHPYTQALIHAIPRLRI